MLPCIIVQSDPGRHQTGACRFSWKEEGIYESGWNKLMEKNYAKREWPEAKIIALLINDDSDGPVPLELPGQWLWDIVDEFIYLWRAKVKAESDEELLMLADGAQSVLSILYSLIQKSKINEYILVQQNGANEEEIAEIVGEYGVHPLYRMLGYFSIVGLLCLHILFGDFTLALKFMENAPFACVIVCYIVTYYYVGFCYIMLRRYPDVICAFVSILNFILRMRQYHAQSYQYNQINKTADRMYALFVICNALSPNWLDGNIVNIVKDRYDEWAPTACGMIACLGEQLAADGGMHLIENFVGDEAVGVVLPERVDEVAGCHIAAEVGCRPGVLHDAPMQNFVQLDKCTGQANGEVLVVRNDACVRLVPPAGKGINHVVEWTRMG
ncbi:hypothetical protein EWM64_g2441 [Hericium alpestre]|uniref:Uncharacterized protein n=1 Tax=Hericium alpestre TaxID=135208 RepID=A0A4Z0A5H6_9AGAM|nr:hypothetical protein EWM64_g2441 [Hericium alpestre]